jgi:hypothetical protein
LTIVKSYHGRVVVKRIRTVTKGEIFCLICIGRTCRALQLNNIVKSVGTCAGSGAAITIDDDAERDQTDNSLQGEVR